jgi:hypothetical protein
MALREGVARFCETEKRARFGVTSLYDSRVSVDPMSHFFAGSQESAACQICIFFTMEDATIESSSTSAPRLHILHLPAIFTEDEGDKDFRTPWVIDDEDSQATPIPRGTREQEHGADDETLSWKGLQTNDLLYFPDQLTGAGEFEGCRFVGERTDQGFVLLSLGIESPIFPAKLVASIGDVSKLRLFYEKLFNIVLEEPHVSLVDIFGGQDVVEEFWTRPDTTKDGQSRRRREDTADCTPWLIPLRQCTWLATISP